MTREYSTRHRFGDRRPHGSPEFHAGRLWVCAAMEAVEDTRGAGWVSFSDRLERALRRHEGLHSGERRRARHTAYVVMRRWRGLWRALAPHFRHPPHRADLPLLFALALALDGQDPALALDPQQSDTDRAAALARVAAAKDRFNPAQVWDFAFVELLKPVYGEAWSRVLEALDEPGPVDIRANPLVVGTRERLVAELEREGFAVEPTPVGRWGLRIRKHSAELGKSPWFARGGFEFQDAGSQAIAQAVDAAPGETIIDVCAGAGGKTLALAAELAGEGRVLAFDVEDRKLRELDRRAERAGADGLIDAAVVEPDEDWPQHYDLLGQADAVLVDAPCTGIGTLRRDPEVRHRLPPDKILAAADRQREILARAATAVAPGGRLVYATCSLFSEENEEVARSFDRGHPHFRRVSQRVLAGVALKGASGRFRPAVGGDEGLRLDPLLGDTDGFYFTGWRRIR